MNPIDFDPLEREFLPPHREVIWAKDGQPNKAGVPRYRPLQTLVLDGQEGRVISRWTLTPAEREAIAKGEDLYLEQLTFGNKLQPILPTVGLRTFCPADPM